jgi:DNA-binding MarR family transcriptional regulator
MNTNDLCDEVLISLRRIVRAIDLQSRQLVRSHGLTGPQTYILKTMIEMGETTIGHLAERVNLSKPTVTDILNRLEKHKLVKRVRSIADKRCVHVTVTALARKKLISSPPLLQEAFAQQFNRLKQWEQYQLISSLQKIAEMMDARDLDASPILSSGPISTPENISEINPPESKTRTKHKIYTIKKTG